MDYDEPWYEYDDNPDWNPSMDDSVADDPEWIYKRDYNGPSSVIEGLIKEWLSVTIGRVPVFGWPLDDQVVVYFKGHIPTNEHAEIDKQARDFFAGNGIACIFPVEDIVICTINDYTMVMVKGDRSRAQEMIPTTS